MKMNCPNKSCFNPNDYIKDGSFKRAWDSRLIQRFRCKSCRIRFSSATHKLEHYQKKNGLILKFLSFCPQKSHSKRRQGILKLIIKPSFEKWIIFQINVNFKKSFLKKSEKIWSLRK